MREIPFPKNLRQILEILALLDHPDGLREVLSRIDWTGVRPRQVYLSCLGRFPESAALADAAAHGSAADQMYSAITSEEFQRNLFPLVAGAYAEKRRNIFVHIPKCGGTSLVNVLRRRLPSIPEYATNPTWTAPEAMLRELTRFVLGARLTDEILFFGHVPLSYYVDQGLCRCDDNLFSIVRPPMDIAVSYTNYFLTRFAADPACNAADTRDWASIMALGSLEGMGKGDLQELGRIILLDTRIIAGVLCTFLGRGTAESAVDLIARTDIEISDMGRLPEWISDRWRQPAAPIMNAAQQYITVETLTSAERDHLQDVFAEDILLYRRIQDAMRLAGSCSIRGGALFRPASPMAAVALPVSQGQRQSRRQPQATPALHDSLEAAD